MDVRRTTGVLTVFLWSLKFSLYIGNRYFIWSLLWGEEIRHCRPFSTDASKASEGIGSVEEGDGIPEPFGMGHIRFLVGFVNPVEDRQRWRAGVKCRSKERSDVASK